MEPNETLTGLAREVTTLYKAPAPDPEAVIDVAARVEQFAREHTNLDPDTHTRLLVQLARNLDRLCPPTIDQARTVIAQTDRMRRRLS
jgi:hypothetical protein